MHETTKEVINEALYDLEVAIMVAKNTIIDLKMFDYLTQESKIPTLIKLCKRCEVSRFDLIDILKDKMVEIISEKEIDNKELDYIYDRDIELIPVDLLTKWMEIEDKRKVILAVGEQYSNLIEDINRLSVSMVNDDVFKTVGNTLNYRGKTYDECINNR